MRKLISCFICTLLFSTYSIAQNSIIGGMVKDSISGAGVAYAQVVILDEANENYVSMGITGENGVYEISGLPLGNYNIKILCLGYQTKIITGIKCMPEQKKLNIDIPLNIDVQVLEAAVIVGDRTSIDKKSYIIFKYS